MSDKYTIMLIPDDEKRSKTYSISRKTVRNIKYLSLLFFLFLGFIFYRYLPAVLEHNNLKEQYNRFASERTKVLALSRDLERIKQMDILVRNSLGNRIDIDDNLEHDDTAKISNSDNYSHLSYLENIPSVAPIQGFITQRSNKQSLFIQKDHYGIDIVSKEGEPIRAAASGLIVFSGWTYEFGNLIIIYHGDDYFTHYGHNQKNLVNSGEIVTHGSVIGLVGSTGISSAPHLHFEIWKGFEVIDPFIFYPEYRKTDLTFFNDKN